MVTASRQDLAVKGARSLVWLDGRLIDVAAGWRELPLDGSRPVVHRKKYGTGYDAAVASPDGDVVALVMSTGIKALLLDAQGEVIRELRRDSYKAGAYRYPLALFTLPDGRTGLVHCPQEWCQLDVEVALTGEQLTEPVERNPESWFHSRLAVSPSGRHLLTAGWVWQPWSVLGVLDLAAGLRNPGRLDGHDDVFRLVGLIQAEVSGACFIGDDVVVSTSPEQNDAEGPDDLAPNMLVRWSTADRAYQWQNRLEGTAGDLVAVGDDVLALHGHPRLYDGRTGELAHEWPDLSTGDADSSIVWKKAFSGPARVAVDPARPRFAVTDGERVTVITLE